MLVQAFDALKIPEHRFGLWKRWIVWAFLECSCYAIFTWIWTYKTHDLADYQLTIGSFLPATTFMCSNWQIPVWSQFFQQRLPLRLALCSPGPPHLAFGGQAARAQAHVWPSGPARSPAPPRPAPPRRRCPSPSRPARPVYPAPHRPVRPKAPFPRRLAPAPPRPQQWGRMSRMRVRLS